MSALVDFVSGSGRTLWINPLQVVAVEASAYGGVLIWFRMTADNKPQSDIDVISTGGTVADVVARIDAAL